MRRLLPFVLPLAIAAAAAFWFATPPRTAAPVPTTALPELAPVEAEEAEKAPTPKKAPAGKARLAHAFKLEPKCRLMALDDADLAPLWDSLAG